LLHDRAGDQHFWVISAFIKSVRGSDPDAALYWLARMLEAGEDPLFVARRLVVLAAEDIGLADPGALPLAIAAHQAAHVLGMPEATLTLTEATLHLALAPKSNSAKTAYAAAAADARATPHLPVPLWLRNAATAHDRQMGFGQGYQYAHDDPEAVVDHPHRPPELEDRQYYRPGAHGAEPERAAHLQRLRAAVERRRGGPAAGPRPPQAGSGGSV
ncbi:MAG TPA: replication-associated recombination protein A, partial [Candidatus Dormibacteraeota bacterium]|nr:replication-associated recombination protein A [Candidatus Dormibacteraeota bacterium]